MVLDVEPLVEHAQRRLLAIAICIRHLPTKLDSLRVAHTWSIDTIELSTHSFSLQPLLAQGLLTQLLPIPLPLKATNQFSKLALTSSFLILFYYRSTSLLLFSL